MSVGVQVLDRGQADGILIRTPNEKWIVIDAGGVADLSLDKQILQEAVAKKL